MGETSATLSPGAERGKGITSDLYFGPTTGFWLFWPLSSIRTLSCAHPHRLNSCRLHTSFCQVLLCSVGPGLGNYDVVFLRSRKIGVSFDGDPGLGVFEEEVGNPVQFGGRVAGETGGGRLEVYDDRRRWGENGRRFFFAKIEIRDAGCEKQKNRQGDPDRSRFRETALAGVYRVRF